MVFANNGDKGNKINNNNRCAVLILFLKRMSIMRLDLCMDDKDRPPARMIRGSSQGR
jgi:hypothetical protein